MLTQIYIFIGWLTHLIEYNLGVQFITISIFSYKNLEFEDSTALVPNVAFIHGTRTPPPSFNVSQLYVIKAI